MSRRGRRDFECCDNDRCGNGLNICTLLPFLLILGNTGLLENKNAITLILLFWVCCGGFCGKTFCC